MRGCMQRREFITLFGGTAAAWPLAGSAQPAVPVIGFLGSETAVSFAPYVKGFLKGLKEVGYNEGDNVTIEYRWANGHHDQLPTLAVDLVGRRVGVIIANIYAARAAKVATTTIPIVFATAADPVENGLVSSLSRPGGNLTGATSLSAEVAPKL